MDGERLMLVYGHKTNGLKLVDNGVSILDELALVTILSEYPEIQMVTKAITPGKTSFPIYKADLDVEKTSKQTKEEVKDEVPWMGFLGLHWAGHSFEEVTILSPNPAFAGVKADEAKGKDAATEGGGC
ncbi:uncharacterized protein LTR77_009570 [Saxophila tyrrhenica]|uniref:Uncharacterized protein n=1 Tax=Saxophila tyrrhenica TaxID=1690608 RepID=A0AAV9NZW0_9PEZI|nr:hypothetical protein LTR77_009570 [Saxophila tyrrhenica]